MSITARVLILLLFSPFVIVLFHMGASRFLLRFKPTVSTQLVCAWCILLCNIPVGFLLWFLVLTDLTGAPLELFSAASYSLVVYNGLGYAYFHFFNMSETARRIRILNEIYSAGRLKASEMDSLYDVGDIFDLRLERLISSGQIEEQKGRYVLKGRLLYHSARAISFWANLIGSPLV